MPDYINREWLLAEYDRRHKGPPGKARKLIAEAPTADVRPVVRGEWIVKGQDVYCSECKKESGYNPFGASSFSDFCPNCGADMRREE